MKKYIIIILLILFSTIALAQEPPINNLIDNIRENPTAYTIVISRSTDNNEVKAATDLAAFLGITSSRFDDEVTARNNLIIIGASDKNEITRSFIPTWEYKDNHVLIKRVSNNLIIGAKNTQRTQKAVDLIKKYEKTSKLDNSEYVVKTSITSTILLILGILVVLILIIVLLIFLKDKSKIHNKLKHIESKFKEKATQKKPISPPKKEKKPLFTMPKIKKPGTHAKRDSSLTIFTPKPIIKTKPVPEPKPAIVKTTPEKPSPEEKKLINYIKTNMKKGYSKKELKKILKNAGVNKELLKKALDKA